MAHCSSEGLPAASLLTALSWTALYPRGSPDPAADRPGAGSAPLKGPQAEQEELVSFPRAHPDPGPSPQEGPQALSLQVVGLKAQESKAGQDMETT